MIKERKKEYTKNWKNNWGNLMQKKIEKNYQWIKNNLYSLKEKTKDSKNYLKIFFDEIWKNTKKRAKDILFQIFITIQTIM